MTTQEQLLEQVYGILDDWKAQQFGGEPIVEALNNLTAVSGTATRLELERIADGLQSLAEVLAQQQAVAGAEMAAALEALGDQSGSSSNDKFEEARRKVRKNVAELSERMGPRLGTGNEALEIDDLPNTSISDRNPILPVPLRPGGDASIYGAGLDTVTEVVIDGSSVAIHRALPGQIDLTVPSDVSDGTVEIVVAFGRTGYEFEAEVRGGQQTQQVSKTRKGVRS